MRFSAVGGDDIYQSRLKKVFRVDSFLIGYTTSFRMGQLLQYKLEIEKQKNEQSDLEYLATTFIDSVRRCLKNGRFTKIESEQEEGGSFLVGYKNKIYQVDTDFQVNSSMDGLMAIGSGANFALGSLWSTKMLSPEKRIRKAFKAAAHFNNTVCKPFHCQWLKRETEK